MEYFLDESCRQKFLQLLADRPALELVEASQALLHRLGVGSNIKGVLGTSLGMLGMSEGLHAKMSALARRKSMSTTSYLLSRVALTCNALSSERFGSRGTFLIPSAGSKLPACRCVESKASLAILSRVAARASSSA